MQVMKANTMTRLFKTFSRADQGVAAIEMAFILPFMLILFFGLIDLTGLISYNRKVTAIASATADLVGQNRTTVLKTDIVDYFKVAGLILNPIPESDVKVRVFGFRKTGATVNKIWQIDNGMGSACSSEPTTTGMLPLMVAGNDLVVAQTCAKYKTFVGEIVGVKILGDTNFKVEQEITLRPRASLTLDCKMTATGSACPAS
jgi:Flp pilus assembly protein TadG